MPNRKRGKAALFRRSALLKTLGCMAAILPALLPSPVSAQDRDDVQQWTLLTLSAKLPHRLRGYFEVQPRISNDISRMGRLLIRPALGYQLDAKTSVWLGYAWTPAFSPTYNNEHRIFQQLLITDKARRLEISNRTRLEERFINGAGDTAVRLRHFLRLAHPLEASGRWFAATYDEIFFNLNSTPRGPSSGLDQNRLYFGLGRTLAPGLKGELGYIFNTVSPPRGASDTVNHVILVTLNCTL